MSLWKLPTALSWIKIYDHTDSHQFVETPIGAIFVHRSLSGGIWWKHNWKTGSGFKDIDSAKAAAVNYLNDQLCSALLPATPADIEEWRAGR